MVAENHAGPGSTLLPPPSRFRSRHASTASFATQNTESTSSLTTGKSNGDAESVFYRIPLYEADQLIIPTATALCEPSWSTIRSTFEATAYSVPFSRQLIVLHPASLVILRSPDPQTSIEVKRRFRETLSGVIADVEERRVGLLGAGAFSESSAFRRHAIDDIVHGGEPYKLAWPWGLEGSVEEELCTVLLSAHMAHHAELSVTAGQLVITIQHIQVLRSPEIRCRLLVRKIKPGIQDICDYFGIDLADLQSLHRERTS